MNQIDKVVRERYDHSVIYDVEMLGARMNTSWWTSPTTALKIGMDGFFCVHLVFKLSLPLFLTDIFVVPIRDTGVCSYSVTE
jgi:hypothetical protein